MMVPFNVFIDTVSPRIELVGPAEYFIVTGTVNPIIPNVTVTDGDPNYSGGFTLNMSDEIDTAIIDSVYNYTIQQMQILQENIPDSVTSAYKGCVLLEIMERRGEYNLMIWTPLSVGAVTSA